MNDINGATVWEFIKEYTTIIIFGLVVFIGIPYGILHYIKTEQDYTKNKITRYYKNKTLNVQQMSCAYDAIEEYDSFDNYIDFIKKTNEICGVSALHKTK